MKRKPVSFFAGILAALLLIALSVSAFASDGSFTIDVHPIRILINGEVFRPKDVNGNDVMVFTVNGTTYAPLRALAEAYGLEVGYDAAQNIATVNTPETAAPVHDDFASHWTVAEKPVSGYGSEKIFTAQYSGSLNMSEFKSWWKSFSEAEIAAGAEQLAAEAQSLVPGNVVTMYFSYGTCQLGSAYSRGGIESSDFRPAGVWIR